VLRDPGKQEGLKGTGLKSGGKCETTTDQESFKHILNPHLVN
jgi:hypothetical protein